MLTPHNQGILDVKENRAHLVHGPKGHNKGT